MSACNLSYPNTCKFDLNYSTSVSIYLRPLFSTDYISPAEIQDDLAKASIENVFVYSARYGNSGLKSD